MPFIDKLALSPSNFISSIEIKFSKFVSEMFPEVLRPKSFDNFI